ncbi:hypothetical protein FACS18949_06230 [Clostridia bacterium]|nr:hypothetical protein FACS18949_06230 [Clostridia bacterium]
MDVSDTAQVTTAKSKNSGYFRALLIITAIYTVATLIADIPLQKTFIGTLMIGFGFPLTFAALVFAGMLRPDKDGTFKDAFKFTVLFPLLFQALTVIVLLPIPMEVSQWWDNFAVQYDGIDLWEYHVGEFLYFILPAALIMTAILAIKPVRMFSLKWSATKRRAVVITLCAVIITVGTSGILYVHSLRAYDVNESAVWSSEGITERIDLVNHRNAKIAKTNSQGVLTTISFIKPLTQPELQTLSETYQLTVEKSGEQYVNARIDAWNLAALQSDPLVFLADASGDGYFRGHKETVSHYRNDIILNRNEKYPTPIVNFFESTGFKLT